MRKTQIVNNINSQLYATIVILLISISSTCFGRQFRPSSGALDCVYSLWYEALTMLPAGSTAVTTWAEASNLNQTFVEAPHRILILH